MNDSATQAIVLPDPHWVNRGACIEAIELTGIRVLDVHTPVESKAVCAAIVQAPAAPRLVVIAHEHSCQLLPAVALSLRTQHRNTAGYILIDPDAPAATDSWPEAPVFVVSSTEATGTSLRGWSVIRSDNDEPGHVARIATELLAH